MPSHRRIGAPSPDADELRAAVDERRQRAIEEPLDVRVRATQPYLRIEVRNPIHETRYLVLFPTYPSLDTALCTCTDFARRGLGTCKHIEAVDRWLATHPDAAPSPPLRPGPAPASVWREIDRRLARETKAGRPMSLRVRDPGAVLFESLPAAKGP